MGSLKIKAEWISADLIDYRGLFEVKVVSIHRPVINLLVKNWPHLLLLTGPKLYRGPATLSFGEENFAFLREVAGQIDRGSFTAGALVLAGSGIEATLDWVGGPVLSFGLPARLSLLPGEVIANLASCRHALMENPASSAAAILLGLDGGEPYFREKFITNFPQFVAALMEGNEAGLINHSQNIMGMGRGSTPTGDDLLCGAMLAAQYHAHWSGKRNWHRPALPVGPAPATTALSAHSLELSARGLAVTPVRNHLLALFSAKWRKDLLTALLAMGSSTGYDLAVSIQVTLEHCFGIEY